MSELCFKPATELSSLLHSRQLGAVELLSTYMEQIDRLNPVVNAIVTLTREQAFESAKQADCKKNKGLLHGLPIGVKDNLRTRGIRTTWGSSLYKDYIPEFDDLIVERHQAAGAIMVGKTNLPELSYGGQTTNSLFGSTLNPYDSSKTCSGSSGGGASALACGMLALADGSDVAGSLRSPAAWCNVVGFRPSPGRIPKLNGNARFDEINVHGPMARTVADIALFMRAVAGPDARSSLSIEQELVNASEDLRVDHKNTRIAWSPDLGFAQVDPEVADVFNESFDVFASLRCDITETSPQVMGASETLLTLKTMIMKEEIDAALARGKADDLSPLLEAGQARANRLSAIEITHAKAQRAALGHRVSECLELYEFLVWPTHFMKPYAIDDPEAESAMNWIALDVAPLLGLPAITVPGGFTPDGLPVGLQIMGRRDHDWDVLRLAWAFEQETGVWKHRPPSSDLGASPPEPD
ncbi:MAG: amidase [Gammaproteobacteria bacterium]|nr:MAG: amidase [Gammaproteobacteria bacterium]